VCVGGYGVGTWGMCMWWVGGSVGGEQGVVCVEVWCGVGVV
jgi:hypothetical protein